MSTFDVAINGLMLIHSVIKTKWKSLAVRKENSSGSDLTSARGKVLTV